MFGGTAQTYCNWKLLGEPFGARDKMYIKVENPKTGVVKEVRWYETQEAHNRMPHKDNEKPWAPFLFENENDTIKVVPSSQPQPSGYRNGFGYWYGKGEEGTEVTWTTFKAITISIY